ncbi:serine/threonine-protein kinase [Georgenia alba]|uniref:non-specific serine/threonine protein kinase n=1 Tax=Georgenia alba TaxID=2233858 RepID=A0ABW2Q458_9MICO
MSVHSTASAAPLAPRPRAGLVLGARYELTDRIAVGGMGEVWRALDRRLGRTVAVKVLRPELVGDDQFLARLRTEARNTAGLQHPNLAMLFDHGEGDGSGYLVMELVSGETLAARLARQGRLSAAELVPILVQACHGLHAAHTAGVVHRDVKPANVMITPDGSVKLTDFGISLAANQPPMTSTGMVMGTAQYLPPEQATGKPATAAGDIYALGVLAHECLVGERPFTGSTQVDVAFAHINTPVPPLPASVPPAVVGVVRRMLAKDPSDRPASARECAAELEAALMTAGATPREVTPPRAAHDVVHHLSLPPEHARRGSARHALGSVPPSTTTRSRRSRPTPARRARSTTPARVATGRDGTGRRLPTWREISEDRVWLAAMVTVVTVLLVLLALIAVGIGNLGGADRTDAAQPTSERSVHITVRTSSG